MCPTKHDFIGALSQYSWGTWLRKTTQEFLDWGNKARQARHLWVFFCKVLRRPPMGGTMFSRRLGMLSIQRKAYIVSNVKSCLLWFFSFTLYKCTMYNVSSFWSSILCVSKNILGFYLVGYQRFIIFIFLIGVSWVSNSRPSGWILNCFAHISVEKTMQARPRPIPDDGENT